MPNARVSTKANGYTAQVTIWMRPETRRALRLLAASRDTTIQQVINDLVGREVRRGKVSSSEGTPPAN